MTGSMSGRSERVTGSGEEPSRAPGQTGGDGGRHYALDGHGEQVGPGPASHGTEMGEGGGGKRVDSREVATPRTPPQGPTPPSGGAAPQGQPSNTCGPRAIGSFPEQRGVGGGR